MSLDDFIGYLKSNLRSEADRSGCLRYLESLSLSRAEAAYAHGMVDRWIRAGLFSGSLTAGWHVRQDETDAKHHQPPAAAEAPSVKRQRL